MKTRYRVAEEIPAKRFCLPAEKHLQRILLTAIQSGASEMQIEPTLVQCRLRYVAGGETRAMDPISPWIADGVLRRLRSLSTLYLAEDAEGIIRILHITFRDRELDILIDLSGDLWVLRF